MSEQDSINPRQVRYVVMSEFLASGGFEPNNSEGWECADNMDVLLEKAKEEAEKNGLVSYIYECKLVRKVIRGPVRVLKIR